MSSNQDEKGMLELLGGLATASTDLLWASLELEYAFAVVAVNVSGLLPGIVWPAVHT